MKLSVKELKGNEITLDESINDSTKISELKAQIENKSGIPASQQKLLYLGKILQDNSSIGDYKISDGGKLMLTRMPKPDLKKLIHTHFCKYYDSETSATMANLFIQNMKKKFKEEISLDDIERLACRE